MGPNEGVGGHCALLTNRVCHRGSSGSGWRTRGDGQCGFLSGSGPEEKTIPGMMLFLWSRLQLPTSRHQILGP